jgi:small subunit ribosomal protein S2
MKPYIYGSLHKVSVFDLTITIRNLAQACAFLQETASSNKDILFVGTKPQARDVIRRVAEETNMHFVANRWLGGMLTNNKVIMGRVKYLNKLREQDAEGLIDELPNKEAAMKRRELAKLERTLGGLSNMEKLPAAMVVVGVNHEDIAVREANKCGIPVIGVVDSDSSPDNIDYVIPANDDAYRSIDILLKTMGTAIKNGLRQLGVDTDAPQQSEETPAAASTEAPAAEAQPQEPVATPEPAQAPTGNSEAEAEASES